MGMGKVHVVEGPGWRINFQQVYAIFGMMPEDLNLLLPSSLSISPSPALFPLSFPLYSPPEPQMSHLSHPTYFLL